MKFGVNIKNIRNPEGIECEWLMSKAVVPSMKAQGGKIVNIASATVMSGSPNWSH